MSHDRGCRVPCPAHLHSDKGTPTLFDDQPRRSSVTKRRKFDDDDPTYLKRASRDGETVEDDGLAEYHAEQLQGGDRWSTWDQSTPLQRGPRPHPDWVVTELAAVDTELGILKTGKEADVYLVDRGIPGTDRRCLLAAKRYRGSQHRLFHRDAGYLEGRRVRESRDNRAMAKRTSVGMQMIASQWAKAEFDALCTLYTIGVPVPYPVQIVGTEVLEQFIGDPVTREAAPRLAQLREDTADLPDLWEQLVAAVTLMARAGYAHGDLSAYNILVHDSRLVLIDLPQIVDVVANPQGREFLSRDALNVATWFAARGFQADGNALAAELAAEANIR
jgi:RIO kinase 1